MSKPGDLIGFSGATALSDVINLATLGVPRWGISHVGLLAEIKGELLLVESTTLDPLPCVVQGKCFDGVQAHRLDDVLAGYKGRVWNYPLDRPLYPFENERLTNFLMQCIGTPYDELGAFRSAGIALSWIESLLHEENLHEIFCSELVAKAYAEVGLHSTADANRWNPNHLLRHLRRKEILLRPIRLK